jgi:hypothetical protein
MEKITRVFADREIDRKLEREGEREKQRDRETESLRFSDTVEGGRWQGKGVGG